MNTRFGYGYVDGDNYKNYGHVVFSGAATPAELGALKRAMSDGEYFIAAQIGIPEVFLWGVGVPDYDDDDPEACAGLKPGEFKFRSDSDHGLHCYWECRQTDAVPDDAEGRTIGDFINEVIAVSKRGWLEFNAEDYARERSKEHGRSGRVKVAQHRPAAALPMPGPAFTTGTDPAFG